MQRYWYEYTISEDSVAGYEASYDGFNITSTLTLEEVGLVLEADPRTIVADGKSTSILTATVTADDGKPVPGVEVVFDAERATFPNGNKAVTDKNGKAKVTLKSEKIEDTKSHNIPVKATVHDTEKGDGKDGRKGKGVLTIDGDRLLKLHGDRSNFPHRGRCYLLVGGVIFLMRRRKKT